ncbi:MAG: 4-(cytidine 5'-diphospho)-2-C-methyl-D-erythritol kinase [Planctomycetota bacterium]
MKSISLVAPAKINLFLEVLAKRPDGYHEIETVMQTVTLFDRLMFKENKKTGRTAGISVDTDHPDLPANRSNLAYQAAALFKKTYHIKQGVEIFIHKQIPIGAGLGGGSSDAATTLLGLNKLWKLGLSKPELSDLAQKLGSDIPFFIYQNTALVKGRGEIIFPIQLKRKFHYVIAWPGIFCPTEKIYRNFNLPLTKQLSNVNIFNNALIKGDSAQLGEQLFNRLDRTAFRLYPELNQFYRYFKNKCRNSLLSGSGSSIFGLVNSEKEAAKLTKELRSEQPPPGAGQSGWLIFKATNYLL